MDIRYILSNKRVQIGLTAAVSAGIGLGLGYILGKKNGETKIYQVDNVFMQELIEADNGLEASFEFKDNVPKKPAPADLDPELEKLLLMEEQDEREAFAYNEVFEKRGENIPNPFVKDEAEDGEDVAEEDSDDIFEEPLEDGPPLEVDTSDHETPEPKDGWDYDEEAKIRRKSRIYVLHQDEFMADEEGYSQSTLTYYDGDQILADEADVPVYNHEAITGELKFGHGSNSPNVVYIRNEELKAEYEVLLFHGYFEREVLGYELEQEAEKSLSHGVLKFRDD